MAIHVTCGCGVVLRAPDSAAGKTAKCPRCGEQIQLPSRDEDDEAVAAQPAPAAPAAGSAVQASTPQVAAGAPPPGPKSRRTLPVLLLSVGIPLLLICGGVVAIVVLTSKGDTTEATGSAAVTPATAKPPPDLGRPPELPAVPAGLTWHEQDKDDVKSAIHNYSKDQVSAFLTFLEILQRENDGPTPEQKAWLTKTTDLLEPRAKAVVGRDFKHAASMLDLRNCLICSAVADKIDKDFLEEEEATLARIREAVTTGKRIPYPVWQVTNAKGARLTGSYDDSSGGSVVTLTPKEGFEFLQVTADVANVSANSDPPYVACAFAGIKGAFLALELGDKVPEPRRAAVDEFLWLVTPAGTWLQSGHVCVGCQKLRGCAVTITSGQSAGTMIFPGAFVTKGDKFTIDVLFSVPKEMNDFKLLMLGAGPVPVKIE